MNKKMMEVISVKKLSSIAIVLCGGAFLVILLQVVLAVPPPQKLATSTQRAEAISAIPAINPFENISVEARAAYVFEVKTGKVLFAKNENEKLPLASVTKLMTALLACEHVSESAVITLTKDDLAVEGDSGLRNGERWRAGDLLNLMLLVSSNDAAHAIASFIGGVDLRNTSAIEHAQDVDAKPQHKHFIVMMNDKARALGLLQTEFFNESGLDTEPGRSGGYGSAHDVSTIILELWNKYPDAVDVTTRKGAHIVSQGNIEHTLSNTNEMVGDIPRMIASKTGFTDLAGGNLAVIFDRGIGDPIVVVVLGSSYQGRFDDVKRLAGASRRMAFSSENNPAM